MKYFLKVTDRTLYADIVDGVGYWDNTPRKSYPEKLARKFQRELRKMRITVELIPAKTLPSEHPSNPLS